MKLTIINGTKQAPIEPRDGPYLSEYHGHKTLNIPIEVGHSDDKFHVKIREDGQFVTDTDGGWTGIRGYPTFRRVRIREIIVEEV